MFADFVEKEKAWSMAKLFALKAQQTESSNDPKMSFWHAPLSTTLESSLSPLSSFQNLHPVSLLAVFWHLALVSGGRD